MTFQKPSTVINQTGAYNYKAGITSPSSNYIDNNFPNILDKTGDTVTNATIAYGAGAIVEMGPGSILETVGATLLFTDLLNLTGGITMHTAAHSTNYAMASTDMVILANQGASTSITITLPEPLSGKMVWIKDISENVTDSFPLVIAPHASEKIDGLASSYSVISSLVGLMLVSNGVNWFIL